MKKLRAKLTKCYGCSVITSCDMFQMDTFYVYGCPCRECLVKMVCEDDICEEYRKQMAKVYSDRAFVSNMRKHKREMRIGYKRNILREKSNETSM